MTTIPYSDITTRSAALVAKLPYAFTSETLIMMIEFLEKQIEYHKARTHPYDPNIVQKYESMVTNMETVLQERNKAERQELSLRGIP